MSVIEESQRSQAQLGWKEWGSREQEPRQGNGRHNTTQTCDKKPWDGCSSEQQNIADLSEFTLATPQGAEGDGLKEEQG